MLRARTGGSPLWAPVRRTRPLIIGPLLYAQVKSEALKDHWLHRSTPTWSSSPPLRLVAARRTARAVEDALGTEQQRLPAPDDQLLMQWRQQIEAVVQALDADADRFAGRGGPLGGKSTT